MILEADLFLWLCIQLDFGEFFSVHAVFVGPNSVSLIIAELVLIFDEIFPSKTHDHFAVQ